MKLAQIQTQSKEEPTVDKNPLDQGSLIESLINQPIINRTDQKLITRHPNQWVQLSDY